MKLISRILAVLGLMLMTATITIAVFPPQQAVEAAPRKMEGIEVKDGILEIVDTGRVVQARIFTKATGGGQPGELELTKGRLVHTPFITTTDADITPSISGGNHFTVTNTGATTITTFDDGKAGQEITLLFTDGNTTVAETGNIFLSAAFTGSADDIMKLVFNGTNWYETDRSVN